VIAVVVSVCTVMYRADSWPYYFITIKWDSLSKTQYNSYNILLWYQLNKFADVQRGQATFNKHIDILQYY